MNFKSPEHLGVEIWEYTVYNCKGQGRSVPGLFFISGRVGLLFNAKVSLMSSQRNVLHHWNAYTSQWIHTCSCRNLQLYTSLNKSLSVFCTPRGWQRSKYILTLKGSLSADLPWLLPCLAQDEEKSSMWPFQKIVFPQSLFSCPASVNHQGITTQLKCSEALWEWSAFVKIK